jgi:hypothetical protein
MKRSAYNKKKIGIIEHFSEDRIAWVVLTKLDVAVYHGKAERPDFEYDPNDVLLSFALGDYKSLLIDMTNFTEEELDAFKTVVMTAIDTARPEIQARDTKAKEDFANGDDTNARLYRPIPRIFTRERKVKD